MKDNTPVLQRPIIIFLLAVICCALWGSAYPCVKTGYRLFQIASDDTASQLFFAGLRFTFAGVMALILGSLIERRPVLPKTSSWKYIAVLALLQTVLQYIFFYIGLAHTSGVKSSILGATGAFFAIFLAALLYRQEKLTWQKALGCLLGFAGVIIVNIGAGAFDWDFRLIGEGFVILSNLAYAFSSIYIKRFSQTEDPVMLSGTQFIAGGLILMAIGRAMGGSLHPTASGAYLLLAYMAFISAAAYSLWGILLKHNPVSRVTIYSFMTPVFGFILSAVILDERSQAAGIKSLAALALICTGIFIVNKPAKA